MKIYRIKSKNVEKSRGFFDSEYSKLKKEFWEEEWQNMPEFVQEQVKAYSTIKVWFVSEQDMQDFSKVIDQNLTESTKSIWYPKLKSVSANRCYVERPRLKRND